MEFFVNCCFFFSRLCLTINSMDAQHYATMIVTRFAKAGYTAYFAGGWVRDYVMGHPSSDIDIATNAPPEKILDLFPHTVLVGLAFGVVVVIYEGHQFEVSTFRKDLGYEDGRKPVDIALSHPEEDAQRRDFTINGMFYDPLENRIIDYVGGMEDIKKGVIRTIGNADERFVEDRLRMIRAVRFSARFGFTIDEDTQLGIMMNADTLFPSVAMERIWQEFNKMAAYPRFDTALIELHRLKLLPVIFPALEQVHLRDLKHYVSSFPRFPQKSPTILYLLELFPNSTLGEQLEICNYLKTSGHDAQLVEYINKLREKVDQEILRLNSVDLVEWAHLYAHPKAELCMQVIGARLPPEQSDILSEKHALRRAFLSEHIERIVKKKPLVSAKVLQENGVSPGKTMGRLIKEAERIAIIHNLHDVESIMQLLKQTAAWKER